LQYWYISTRRDNLKALVTSISNRSSLSGREVLSLPQVCTSLKLCEGVVSLDPTTTVWLFISCLSFRYYACFSSLLKTIMKSRGTIAITANTVKKLKHRSGMVISENMVHSMSDCAASLSKLVSLPYKRIGSPVLIATAIWPNFILVIMIKLA
jgi:hypothetical protein